MLSLQTFIVDSFTDRPFSGNPAGVQFVDTESTERMQNVALELGCSETAFIRESETSGEFSIRFFSPKREIPLCGHATLAAARVVMDKLAIADVCFRTLSGLQVRTRSVGSLIEMDFPVYSLEPAKPNGAMLRALGVEETNYWGFNRELNILVIEIGSAEELVALKPDYRALENSHSSISGVSVTAKGDESYDFYSRYFWPWSGTNEDPVTGGTHTFLAGYWGAKTGKSQLRSYQASKRGGWMEVELISDEAMKIRGQACIVLEGKMYT